MATDLRQTHFRFGKDDGTESAHTFWQLEDVNHTQVISADWTFLLRFTEQESGGTAAANTDAVFQYNKNGAGWVDITTTSSVVKAVAVGAFTNGQACTKRLSGTGTFETSGAGCTEDGSSGANANDIEASGNSETEAGLQVVFADVANNDTIQFRFRSPDWTITYTITPTLTISIAGTNWTKNLADTITCNDSQGKGAGKKAADTMTLVDAPVKAPGLNKADALNLLDSFSRIVVFNRTFGDTLSLADTLVKGISLAKADTLTLGDELSYIKTITKTLADTISLLDAQVKAIGKITADSIALTDDFSRQVDYLRNLNDTLALIDSISKSLSLLKSDALTLSDLFDYIETEAGQNLTKNLADTLTLVDASELRKWRGLGISKPYTSPASNERGGLWSGFPI